MLNRLDNLADSSQGTTVYAQYAYLGARVVTGYRLSPWTGNLALAPKTWTFQGSDDASQWTDLDSQSNVTNWTAAYNEYHFANSTAYRHYRLRITANNNNNAGCVCVAEMDLEGPLVGPEFRYDLEVTHQAGTTGRAAAWAASNVLDDVKYWDDHDSEAVSLVLVGGASPTLVLANHESGGGSDTSAALSTQTKYYLSVERAEADTVEVRIYSDSDRTTLVDTLSVGVNAGRTWRYLFAANSYNDATTHTVSLDVQNLALVTVSTAPAPTGDYYYNESWQVLEERPAGTADASVQYVWDQRYIDAPVLRWRDTNGNGTLDEVLYFCNDANMSVTALIDQSTGLAVERTSFAAYGQATFYGGDWSTRSDSEFASEILYAGYRYDPETGMDYARMRYYEPPLGIWTSRDPSGYQGGTGLYGFELDNPGRYSDPYGLWPINPVPFARDLANAALAIPLVRDVGDAALAIPPTVLRVASEASRHDIKFSVGGHDGPPLYQFEHEAWSYAPDLLDNALNGGGEMRFHAESPLAQALSNSPDVKAAINSSIKSMLPEGAGALQCGQTTRVRISGQASGVVFGGGELQAAVRKPNQITYVASLTITRRCDGVTAWHGSAAEICCDNYHYAGDASVHLQDEYGYTDLPTDPEYANVGFAKKLGLAIALVAHRTGRLPVFKVFADFTVHSLEGDVCAD